MLFITKPDWPVMECCSLLVIVVMFKDNISSLTFISNLRPTAYKYLSSCERHFTPEVILLIAIHLGNNHNTKLILALELCRSDSNQVWMFFILYVNIFIVYFVILLVGSEHWNYSGCIGSPCSVLLCLVFCSICIETCVQATLYLVFAYYFAVRMLVFILSGLKLNKLNMSKISCNCSACRGRTVILQTTYCQ